MNFRRSLLIGTSTLALNAALTGTLLLTPEPAQASCTTVSSNTTISSSISCVTWDSNNVSITGGGIVSGTNTAVGIASGSVTGTLTNSGTVVGTIFGANNNDGTVTAIINAVGGTISITNTGCCSGAPIWNGNGGTIGTISNSGVIANGYAGISNAYNSNNIGTITNSGTISGSYYGILNNYTGTIGLVSNTGTISGTDYGIFNSYNASIGTITNSGTINGGFYNDGTIGSGGTAINSSGVINGFFYNYGTINGNINVNQVLTITGSGPLTGGTITTNNHDFILAGAVSQVQVLGDNIDVGVGHTFSVTGAIQANTILSITGNYAEVSSGNLVIGVTDPSHYGDLVISGNAAMTDDTVTISPLSGPLSAGEVFTIAQDAGTASYNGIAAYVGGHGGLGASLSSIVSNGFNNLVATVDVSCQVVSGSDAVISGGAPCVLWQGHNVSIAGSGVVSGSLTGVINTGNNVGTLTNSGSIGGRNTGVYNAGTIAAVTNSGTITGGTYGVNNNAGTIGTITNSGAITGSNGGIFNSGTIGAIVNASAGTISATDGNCCYDAVNNSGTIGTINNAGTIIAARTVISNNYGDSIGTITNSGTIIGARGISSDGTIGTIANNGVISGKSTGIKNWTSIGTITNNGTITGGYAIANYYGTIGSGGTAVDSTGTIIGNIYNRGTIDGNITLNQTVTIVSQGFGTLTGGTITAQGLTFGPVDYQMLNDNIVVGSGSGTVANNGVLQINAAQSITGNYTQGNTGWLVIGGTDATHYGELVVSGNANLANDFISIASISGLAGGDTLTILSANASGTSLSGIEVMATGFLPTVSSITGATDFLTVSLSVCSNQTISGTTTFSSRTCGITWSGGNLSIASAGYVAGSSAAVLNSGNTVGTLINSGFVSGSSIGVNNTGSIAGIVNQSGGFINGIGNNGSIGQVVNASGGILGGSSGIYNSIAGTIGTVTNSGTIRALYENKGMIGTIMNSAVISSGDTGIYNKGTIGTIINSGTVSGYTEGIGNSGGTIGTIINTGLISGNNGANCCTGIYNNAGTIGTITNSGTIIGFGTGIYNSGTITAINNSGVIAVTLGYGAYAAGIANSGSGLIGVIDNSGTIIGTDPIAGVTQAGIGNYGAGTIGTITNSGTIIGSEQGIYNASSIGTIDNSGLISGPSAIYGSIGSTILSALTNTGTIAGNINVSQDLTITGGNASTIGTLTGYNGSIGTITATNLVFDSNAYQLLDDDVNVGSGSGTVTNSGTLRLNAAHSITGNYVQGSGALLVVGVTDPSHYGDLVISGNASMANDLVSITGSLSSGEHLTIVQDAGTYDYSGITATVGAGYTASVSSISNSGFEDLIVALTQTGGFGTIGSITGGGAAPALGAALDQIQIIVNNGGDSGFGSILTALDNIGSISGQGAEGAAIKQLGPNPITGQVAANGQLANETFNMIGQHQETLLQGDNDYASNSQNNGQAPDGQTTTGKASGDAYQNGVFWGQAGGGIANRGSTAEASGYRQSLYGLAFGADDHITKDMVGGLAFSWAASGARGIDDLNGNTTSVNSFQLTGYGTKHWGPGFVNLMAGLGYNLFSERRNIGFLGETARASYGGMQYMGRVDGGWNFPQDNHVTLTPLIGLQAVRVDTNGYSETGAGAADASVSRQITDIFTTTLGGRVTMSLPSSWGLFTPEVKLLWAHDLTHGDIGTTATLGGVSFATATPRAAQDGAELTLATTLASIPGQSDALSLRAEYDGDLRVGYQSHTGVLKFSWDF